MGGGCCFLFVFRFFIFIFFTYNKATVKEVKYISLQKPSGDGGGEGRARAVWPRAVLIVFLFHSVCFNCCFSLFLITSCSWQTSKWAMPVATKRTAGIEGNIRQSSYSRYPFQILFELRKARATWLVNSAQITSKGYASHAGAEKFQLGNPWYTIIKHRARTGNALFADPIG